MKNPTGARCDVYDHAVNVWGKDPKTGFARRPLDNVGIQYGLGALNAGVISKQQFLDLNAKIGGYDNDGKVVAARTVADPAAIRIAYRMGRMTWGGGGLATTPILDYRAYLDDAEGGNIHLRYHSFSTRERLQKANGYTDNQVMLTDDRRWGDSLKAPVLRNGLAQMDQWLTKIADDTSNDSKLTKLRRAKPADLVDACWTRDEASAEDRRAAAAYLGQVQRALPGELVPTRRRRQPARGRRHQMPAEARVGVGLQDDVHRRRNGAAEADLPGRRVRLVEARHRAAADGGYLAVPPGGAAQYRDAIGNIRARAGPAIKKGGSEGPALLPTSPLPYFLLQTYFFHFSTFQLFHFERGASRARA